MRSLAILTTGWLIMLRIHGLVERTEGPESLKILNSSMGFGISTNQFLVEMTLRLTANCYEGYNLQLKLSMLKSANLWKVIHSLIKEDS